MDANCQFRGQVPTACGYTLSGSLYRDVTEFVSIVKLPLSVDQHYCTVGCKTDQPECLTHNTTHGQDTYLVLNWPPPQHEIGLSVVELSIKEKQDAGVILEEQMPNLHSCPGTMKNPHSRSPSLDQLKAIESKLSYKPW